MSGPRPIGLWTATSLVVGGMIGSGVFLLPATLAPYGAASLLGWGATLCGALLLALVYAWFARSRPVTGGSYTYARDAFGDGTGFVVAWSYWICNWCGNAALAVAVAGSLGAVVPAVNATPAAGLSTALAALWFCTGVSVMGFREAGFMQLLTTLLKLVPLVLFGLVGLAYVKTSAYFPFNPSHQPVMQVTTAVAALTLWAFIGLEAATVPAGAIQDPERTVPRATLAGVLIAGLATMLACTVVLGLLPANELQKSAAPLADAAVHLWGPAAGIGVGIVATISCFGCLNGFVFLQAQMPMVAAQQGLFPRAFGKVDKNGSPRFGVLISSCLSTLLVFANFNASLVELFTFSILLSTAAALLPYAITAAAWLHLNRTARMTKRLVALGALVYSLWALIGTGVESLLWGGGLLLAGLPVYWLSRRNAPAVASAT